MQGVVVDGVGGLCKRPSSHCLVGRMLDGVRTKDGTEISSIGVGLGECGAG